MKVLRILCSVLFLISVGAYWGYDAYAAKKMDTTYPVIESNSDTIEVACNATDTELLEGLTASDEKDGDLSNQILVDSISNFLEPGVSNIHYMVFDADHHKAEYTRTIRYTDYEAPKFELSKPLIYTNADTVTILDRISAKDQIEGDITNRIKVDSSYSIDSAKGKTIRVEVSNKFGDVQTLSLPVTIQNTSMTEAEITLTKYLIYAKNKAELAPEKYLDSVMSYDGTELKKKNIKIVSKVDWDKAGVYPVYYYYKDEDCEGRTILLVVVK